MTGAKTAEQILLTKREHSAECNRHQTGAFDRTGICERCTAFLALNKARFG